MKKKRTLEGLRRHRERSKEAKKRKRLDPEYRKLEALRAKARYHQSKDKYIKASSRWQEEHRSEVNERRNFKRKLNPGLARAKDKKWRANSLKGWLTKLRRGDCTVDEFLRRYSETALRLDERFKKARGDNTHDSSGTRKAIGKFSKSEA